MHYVLLALAICFEVAATTSLKLSEGFTRLIPSVVMVVCYVASFGALAFALKRLEVSVAYAVWSGAGTAAIAVIGALFLQESMTLSKAVAILLIIAGVVILELGATH